MSQPEKIVVSQAKQLAENDLLADEAKALMKDRRKHAHGRLLEWGKHRERVGFSSLSIAAKIKLERDGANHRSVAILGEGTLNQVERQSERLGRVLQVERWVRMMPNEWIVVVVGCYVEHRTQTAMAQALQLDRERVVHRLQDIQERIMMEIDAQALSVLNESSRLTLCTTPT